VIVVFSFDRFTKDWLVYLVTFGSIIGTMSFPTWFFQGMEKMKFITYLTLGSRLIYTIAIFIFVQSEEDFLFVPLLNFLSLFIIGIISLVVIYKEFGVVLRFPGRKYIFLQFYKGWYLFISHFSINLFTGLNMIILGMVSSNLIVGYYALAEKVVTIIISLFSPVNQALYPHVVQLVKKSRELSIKFVKKIFRYIFFASTLIWLFFVIFSKIIFILVFGEDSINALSVFYILSALIIIRPLAAWTYNVILISFKQEKHFVKMFLTAAVVNIIIIVILLPWFGAKENVIAFSLVVSEIIALSLGLYLYKSKVLRSKGSL
jgi:PST family polysaccharide transporter